MSGCPDLGCRPNQIGLQTMFWSVMKRTFILLVVCLTAGCSSTADHEKLQGNWLMHAVYGEFHFCRPAGKGGTEMLSFADDNFTYRCPGSEGDTSITGSFTCDPSKDPKEITFNFNGRSVIAIYDIGRQLRICVGEKDNVPPTQFDGGAPQFKSSRPALMIFDRAPSK